MWLEEYRQCRGVIVGIKADQDKELVPLHFVTSGIRGDLENQGRCPFCRKWVLQGLRPSKNGEGTHWGQVNLKVVYLKNQVFWSKELHNGARTCSKRRMLFVLWPRKISLI